MRNRHAALLVFALLFWPQAGLRAQQPSCQQFTVPVSVVHGNGTLVSGLTAQNLRGEVRGQPIQVRSVAPETASARLVVLMDSSGSMGSFSTGIPRNLGNVAAQVVQSAPKETAIALLDFATRIRNEVAFSEGREAVLKELTHMGEKTAKRTSEEYRTALWDAIHRALTLMEPPRPGDVILVITDGHENSSKTKLRTVEEALLSGGARLFSVFLFREEPERPREIITEEGASEFKLLVEASGEKVLAVNEAYAANLGKKDWREPFQKALLQLIQQMFWFYRVEVELPQPLDKPRRWKLEAFDNDGKKLKNVTLYYPQKLYPCSATASPGIP